MNATRIDRLEAKRLALEELARFADVIGGLSEEEWGRPTDCTHWDVRNLALHVLGSAEAQASFPEFVRQLRRGLPLNKEIGSHHWVDGMNEWQIRQRHHLSNAAITAQLAVIRPKAVKGRWATPPPVRYLPIPFEPPSTRSRSGSPSEARPVACAAKASMAKRSPLTPSSSSRFSPVAGPAPGSCPTRFRSNPTERTPPSWKPPPTRSPTASTGPPWC